MEAIAAKMRRLHVGTRGSYTMTFKSPRPSFGVSRFRPSPLKELDGYLLTFWPEAFL